MKESFITGSLIDVLSYLAEIAVLCWFFSPIHEKKDAGNNKLVRAAGYIPLLFLLVLYLTPLNAAVSVFSLQNLVIQIFRMAIHLIPIMLFLHLTKGIEWKTASYLAAIFTAIYLTSQNLRLVVMTYGAVTPPHSTQGKGYVIGVILVAASEFILAALTRYLLKPERIDNIDRPRALMMTVVLMLMVYFKWILTAIRELDIGGNVTMMVSFSLVSSIGLYLVLLLFDYSRRLMIENKNSEHEKTVLQFEVSSAKREMQAGNDIRRLYHDVKNHLLAIQSMAGSSSDINDYLSELLPQFEGYETQVKTGNDAVDAILSEKIQRAYPDGIRFNVCLDLSPLDHVKTVDLIIIIGNAVDNAIEALRKIDAEEKFLFIKSSVFANNLILRFQNSYTGDVETKNGMPVTSKKNAEMHGIGISSIKNAVSRYGGIVTVKADNTNKEFTLVVMLPIAKADNA